MRINFKITVSHSLSLLLVFAILPFGSVALAQLDLSPAVDESSGKWGFVESNGKFVIPPTFELCGRFVSGVAPVMSEIGWGYVSPNGEFQIPATFQFADEFSEEVAAVINKDGKLQYIDVKGNVRLETEWRWGEKFSEGQAVVKTGAGGYSIIDLKGNRLTEIDYKFIGECHSGFASVQRSDNSWTYLANGKELPGNYQYAGSFSGGFAWVRVENRYGLIDQNMKFVINPKYDFAARVKDEFALIRDASNVKFLNFGIASFPSGYVPDLVSLGQGGPIGYAIGNTVFAFDKVDKKGLPVIQKSNGNNLVEVGLTSNQDSVEVYRPTKWEYERAKRSADLSKLLTPDYQCPSNTDCVCSLNRYTEYRIIFVWGTKKKTIPCIPPRDTKVRGDF